MSYRSALVDQGRRVSKTKGTTRNELGEYTLTPHNGPWFRCRLDPPKSTESRTANQAARQSTETQLLLDKTFILAAQDRVEVNSKELGRAVWLVKGDPTPIRRRRALIGWTATVQRVETL